MLLGFLDGAVSITLGAVVLVCEGLQSICLTQGWHPNVCSETYCFFFFSKKKGFNFLMIFLLCDLSFCASYRA